MFIVIVYKKIIYIIILLMYSFICNSTYTCKIKYILLSKLICGNRRILVTKEVYSLL